MTTTAKVRVRPFFDSIGPSGRKLYRRRREGRTPRERKPLTVADTAR
jgi:hypothetical protein